MQKHPEHPSASASTMTDALDEFRALRSKTTDLQSKISPLNGEKLLSQAAQKHFNDEGHLAHLKKVYETSSQELHQAIQNIVGLLKNDITLIGQVVDELNEKDRDAVLDAVNDSPLKQQLIAYMVRKNMDHVIENKPMYKDYMPGPLMIRELEKLNFESMKGMAQHGSLNECLILFEYLMGRQGVLDAIDHGETVGEEQPFFHLKIDRDQLNELFDVLKSRSDREEEIGKIFNVAFGASQPTLPLQELN